MSYNAPRFSFKFASFNRPIASILLISLIIQRNNTTVWRRGVVVITTAQVHSSKFELTFCPGLNPARCLWEIATVRISDTGPGWK